MLYHAELASTPDAYVVQHVFEVAGDLDPVKLSHAWEALCQRHALLRSRIHWNADGMPELAVPAPGARSMSMELAAFDGGDLEDFLQRDRTLGFEIEQGPLVRLTLLDRPSRFLVWTSHHLLLDGWSKTILLKELAEIYVALVRDQGMPSLPAAPSYEGYLAWLENAEQSSGAAAIVQREFRNCSEDDIASLLGVRDARTAGQSRVSEIEFEVTSDGGLPNQLLGVTPATVFLAAWGLVLGVARQRHRALFGTVVSCRPPSVDGAERMVGLLINTLPTLIDINPSAPIDAWLRELQRRHARLRTCSHVSLAEMRTWFLWPPTRPLFDTLIAFENYPGASERDAIDLGEGARLSLRRAVERTGYAMTLRVVGAGPFRVSMQWESAAIDAAFAEYLTIQYGRLLDDLFRGLSASVGGLLSSLPSLEANPRFLDAAIAPTLPGAPINWDEPRTARIDERTLAILWCDVLDLPSINPDDNFFDVGGDSLRAMRLMSQLRQRFEIALPLSALFETPTVRGLAARAAAHRT
jgi:acyl carrier protein